MVYMCDLSPLCVTTTSVRAGWSHHCGCSSWPLGRLHISSKPDVKSNGALAVQPAKRSSRTLGPIWFWFLSEILLPTEENQLSVPLLL